jgi:hypothetical protein
VENFNQRSNKSGAQDPATGADESPGGDAAYGEATERDDESPYDGDVEDNLIVPVRVSNAHLNENLVGQVAVG